ncbi:hypothetical protein [Leifsonia shinshuensis]|uniref:hypothetical protein n=1 Tax=Leifsonia shinshuensis TaxID=150026 RepID=UPI0031EE1A23
MKTAALPRLMKIWLYVVLVVLALPLVSMLVLSLNQSRYGTFPFHFTLDWYATLGNDTALIGALETSLTSPPRPRSSPSSSAPCSRSAWRGAGSTSRSRSTACCWRC